jgi:hypothetical protein
MRDIYDTYSSAASLSKRATCSLASRTLFFAISSARSASRSAASACLRLCVAAAMLGSLDVLLPKMPEERDVLAWCDDVVVVVAVVSGAERWKSEGLRAGAVVTGGGEGSRREEPKRGMVWYVMGESVGGRFSRWRNVFSRSLDEVDLRFGASLETRRKAGSI